MKLLSSLFILFIITLSSPGQSSNSHWKWVGGIPLIWQRPSYGSLGVEGVLNRPQGRANAACWPDTAGNAFILGGNALFSDPAKGNGAAGEFNDFWKYNANLNRWTWIGGDSQYLKLNVYGTQGLPSPSAKPGGRQDASTWKDKSGNLWLFGGYYTTDDVFYRRISQNDLWTYDPRTKLWAWINGDTTNSQPGIYGTKGVPDPSNRPVGRNGSFTWTDDAGMLWLFGGGFYNYSRNATDYFNDLWKFDPSTKQWTWVSGENRANQKGVFGVKGQSGPQNLPPCRQEGVSWKDPNGNLWLFGGYSLTGPLNDLWEYSITSNEWTFVSGDTIPNGASIYGTKGIPAIGNKPGGRYSAQGWTDPAGNFWLYGGVIINSPDGFSAEFWKFDLALGLWTWLGGSTGWDRGTFGTRGVYASSNQPGQRGRAAYWSDSAGNFWLMGGSVDDPGTNDVWKYNLSNGQWTWMNGEPTRSGSVIPPTKANFAPSDLDSVTLPSNSWPGNGKKTWLGNGSALWKYDSAAEKWLWQTGEINASLSYGTRGIAAATNNPGPRTSTTFVDRTGNLWLYGDAQYYRNDLWKFDVSTRQWTWMKGQTGISQLGYSGYKGFPDPDNIPRSRRDEISWTDSSGNFWLYGGIGPSYASNQAPDVLLNDLWRFNTMSGDWTWMSGSQTPNASTVYGTIGVPAPANNPPAGQLNGKTWTDAVGNLWLLTQTTNRELWKFDVTIGNGPGWVTRERQRSFLSTERRVLKLQPILPAK